MADTEFFEFFFIREQRIKPLNFVHLRVHQGLQTGTERFYGNELRFFLFIFLCFIRRERCGPGCTRGDKELGVRRNKDLVLLEFQGLDKPETQHIHEVEWSAQKSDVSPDGLPAGKTRNRSEERRVGKECRSRGGA